jgi:hypothetical protein
MTFHTRGWGERFTQMGDEAEGIFELHAQHSGLKFERFGWNRPSFSMTKLPTRLRYTPDYCTSNNLVEVQGLGKDQVFKIKLEKYNSLRYWNDLHPVVIFVWDSYNERYCFVTLDEIDKLIARRGATLDAFHEGKAYFAIPADRVFNLAAGREDALVT